MISQSIFIKFDKLFFSLVSISLGLKYNIIAGGKLKFSRGGEQENRMITHAHGGGSFFIVLHASNQLKMSASKDISTGAISFAGYFRGGYCLSRVPVLYLLNVGTLMDKS